MRVKDELILEGIVTSTNADGTQNVSPMGPIVDRAIQRIHLRPFQTSTTFANLKRTGQGVFHVTDDIQMLAKTAIGSMASPPAMHPCEAVEGMVLSGACRWYAFVVNHLDDSQQRAEIQCRVVGQGRLRDFLGWNRAQHAVLEAAILATRLHILPKAEVLADLERLRAIVDKTAGEDERAAFRIVQEHVQSQSKAE